MIIENKVGVGGRLAADALMAAAPDGLTYMIAPNATPTFQTLVFGSQIKWDIWRDFAPVAGLVSYPLGMAVSLRHRRDQRARVRRLGEEEPAAATFGTPGLGGQNHFLGVQFAKAAGIDLPVTPYKGTPPLITDLVGGHVPAAVTLMDEMLKYHRAGKVRVIGIFSDKRSELMPDIPTMAEQGIKVAGAATAGPRCGRRRRHRRPRSSACRRRCSKILATPEVREFADDTPVGDAALPERARRWRSGSAPSWRPGSRSSRLRASSPE